MYDFTNGFVCAVQYYPNCRGHDEGYYHSVQFFKTFQQVLDYAIKEIAENEIVGFYSKTGEHLGEFKYEISGHNASGIKFESETIKLRTIDDGNGNLIWKEV